MANYSYITGGAITISHPIDHPLLRERARHGRRRTDRGMASVVSRAGYGTLRRWRRTQRVRPLGCARTVGRKRPRPSNDHCLTPHRWQGRQNPTLVSVPTGREVPRHRKYRRSSEFHLPVAVVRWLEKCSNGADRKAGMTLRWSRWRGARGYLISPRRLSPQFPGFEPTYLPREEK